MAFSFRLPFRHRSSTSIPLQKKRLPAPRFCYFRAPFFALCPIQLHACLKEASHETVTFSYTTYLTGNSLLLLTSDVRGLQLRARHMTVTRAFGFILFSCKLLVHSLRKIVLFHSIEHVLTEKNGFRKFCSSF